MVRIAEITVNQKRLTWEIIVDDQLAGFIYNTYDEMYAISDNFSWGARTVLSRDDRVGMIHRLTNMYAEVKNHKPPMPQSLNILIFLLNWLDEEK